jgi:hypothetical protein
MIHLTCIWSLVLCLEDSPKFATRTIVQGIRGRQRAASGRFSSGFKPALQPETLLLLHSPPFFFLHA